MEAPSLTPLACEQCGGVVPLATGERTQCPFCGASVEIPEPYRALRDADATFEKGKAEAAELARALARVPSRFVRWMAMFDSWAFLFFGLGFWITAGVFVAVLVPPIVGRWFGISTIDVFTEKEQAIFTMVFPLATFSLGFLGAGWARKRAIVRGGLQAALAARPPARVGAPQCCRQCGAALTLDTSGLSSTCSYCRAVNLVNIPVAWVAGMRRHAARLGAELDAARKAWTDQRSSLRISLILRGIAGVLIVGFPTVIIAASPDAFTTYTPVDDAYGPPGHLPSWRAHRQTSLPRVGFCRPATVKNVGFITRAEACDRDGCRGGHRLVPLARGETLRFFATGINDGTEVELQIHERTFFDDRWATVERAPLTPAAPVTMTAPISAWYRVEYTIPLALPSQIFRVCMELANGGSSPPL